jgi:hypothetical protein
MHTGKPSRPIIGDTASMPKTSRVVSRQCARRDKSAV